MARVVRRAASRRGSASPLWLCNQQVLGARGKVELVPAFLARRPHPKKKKKSQALYDNLHGDFGEWLCYCGSFAPPGEQKQNKLIVII